MNRRGWKTRRTGGENLPIHSSRVQVNRDRGKKEERRVKIGLSLIRIERDIEDRAEKAWSISKGKGRGSNTLLKTHVRDPMR